MRSSESNLVALIPFEGNRGLAELPYTNDIGTSWHKRPPLAAYFVGQRDGCRLE